MIRAPFLAATLAIAFGSFAPQALAYDASTVPEKKQTSLKLFMSAVEAHNAIIEAKSSGRKILLIDVRTPEELAFVGVGETVSANIPYKLNVPPSANSYDGKKSGYLLANNDKFVQQVTEYAASKKLGKNDEIILMCRSGDRSANAANDLAKAGFTRVYSVYEGFEGDMNKEKRREVNGWKNSGLPWSYSVTPGQVEPLIGTEAAKAAKAAADAAKAEEAAAKAAGK